MGFPAIGLRGGRVNFDLNTPHPHLQWFQRLSLTAKRNTQGNNGPKYWSYCLCNCLLFAVHVNSGKTDVRADENGWGPSLNYF